VGRIKRGSNISAKQKHVSNKFKSLKGPGGRPGKDGMGKKSNMERERGEDRPGGGAKKVCTKRGKKNCTAPSMLKKIWGGR